MATVGETVGEALGLIGAITFWTTIPSVVALGGEEIEYCRCQQCRPHPVIRTLAPTA